MSDARFLATMLASHELLERFNPGLLDWTDRRWRAWVEGERAPRSFDTKPRFIAVAWLTCLDDLHLHTGLMQLLHLSDVRAELILTLPSADALEIARAEARRDGWLGLVTVMAEADWPALHGRLADDQPVALFSAPAVLTSSELDAACARLAARGSGDVVAFAHLRIGCAKDFGTISAKVMPSALERLIVSGCDALDETKASAPSARHDHAIRQASVQLEGGNVALPPLRRGDQLLVTALPVGGDAMTIARLSGKVHDGQREVRLSPAPALLTTCPQRLRIAVSRGDGPEATSDFLFHVPPAQIEPWMLAAFLNRGGAGNTVIQAFAAGTGCRLAFAEDEPETLRDIPVVWGVLRQSDRILDQAKRQSLYFYYIDHAYFDRGHGHSYRIARNAYEAGPIRICPSDRFDALGVEIAPWRKRGREIIVCPPTDYFMHAHGCTDWLETTLAGLKTVTDRPIVVRVKPQPGEAATPLRQALETAHALVTHSSNVAIETACLGTPVFVSPTSAAAPVGRTDIQAIEAPVYPDRSAWLAHLAYSQYSLEEIGDGRAWRMLRELESRDVA